MRIKLIIILLAIVFYNNAMVLAYDAAVDGIYYNLVSKGLVAEVTAGDEAYIGHIKIPSEVSINGEIYSVTSIGAHAFFGCTDLLSVTIPNSITSIGWQAFGNCSMLESVQIPSSVTTIEGYTFRNCTNLRSVYLPNSLTKIDNSAFRKCSNLKDVNLPNSLIEIEGFAFCECESLESITIGNQLTTIGGDAFNGCNGLKEVHIPSLQVWLNISFKYSSANPLFYAHKLFIDNVEIAELYIPNNITEIKSYAFAGGDFISVSIPESVRSIGTGSFWDCLGLKSIIIPDGVISIDNSSFYGCQNLEAITLSKSVKSIGAVAFGNCKELKNIYSYSETPPQTSVSVANQDIFGGSYIEYATLHVPYSSIEKYKSAAPWNNFKEIVPIDSQVEIEISAEGDGSVGYNNTIIRGETKVFNADVNSAVVITFIPNTGYQIGRLKVNNVDVTSSISNNTYTVSSISQNTTVSVVFEAINQTTYTLSIISSGGGSVSYSNYAIDEETKSFTVNAGTSASLTITPDDGYRVGSLKINGADITPYISNNKYTINNIQQNITVIVSFEAIPPTTYSLSISSSGNGIVRYSGKNINNTTQILTINEGTSAFVSFIPNTGYQIKSVTINGEDVTNYVADNQYTISNITQNTSVEVVFEAIPPITYLLSITSSGYGFVSYSYSTVNGTTKSFSIEEGSSVTLEFTTINGYRLGSLVVNDENVTSDVSDNKYTISNISQNTTVRATFEAIPIIYSLTITTLSNGKVYCDGKEVQNTIQTFNKGESVELLFLPNDGFRLRLLTADGTDVTSNVVDNKYIISNISNDIKMNVVFEAIPPTAYTLSITSSENGTVSFEDSDITDDTFSFEVDEGDTFTLFFIPDDGYQIGSLIVNGVDVTSSVGEDYYYTISNVSKDMMIKVTFEPISSTIYTLTITSFAGGYVTYSGNTIPNGGTRQYNVIEGSSAILTFSPNSGYRVKCVVVNEKNVTSNILNNKYTISNISQNTTVDVEFEEDKPAYDVSKYVHGYATGGAIMQNNDLITSGSQLTWLFENKSEVDVTLKSMQLIDGKTNSEGNLMAVDELVRSGRSVTYATTIGLLGIYTPVTCRFRYEYDGHEYTAEAVYKGTNAYTLTISSTGRGKAICKGTTIREQTSSFEVSRFSSETITFTPDNGCRIKSVIVNGTNVTSQLSNHQYTINSIIMNSTVEVAFEEIPTTYTLSVTSSGSGSVTYSGNTISGTTKSFTVNEGTSALLSFTPNSSYQVGSLKVNGLDVTSGISDNKYTINSVSGNTTVIVTFEEKVIPDGSMVMYKDVYYRVLSGKDKTVTVANGEYAQSLDIPATITVNDMTLNVKGIESNVITDNPQLAAVIWNPVVKFDAKVSNPNFLLYVTSAEYAPSGIKNIIVNGTANSVTLTDADGGNDFYCPKAFAARSISYTHNYSMITGVGECRGWETIALPFNVQKIVHSEKGQVVPFAVWQKGETQRPFWLYELTGNGWKEAGVIKAYTPYVISMPNNELYYESSCLNGQVTFSAENVAVEATNSHKVSYKGKTFIPNFSVRESGGYVYALNVKNDWVAYNGSLAEGSHFVQNLRKVHPFEAYMTTENNARAAFSIFDDDATEVQGVKMLLDQRKIKGVYNLNGQKLDEDNDKKLPAGVYIIGGQKVMVK